MKNQNLVKTIVIIVLVVIAGWFIVKYVKRYMGLYMGGQVVKKATEGVSGISR